METNSKDNGEMSLKEIGRLIVANKRLFVKTLTCAFIFGVVVSLSIPKSYKSKVMLSPETSNGAKSLGNLGALTSMLGANLNLLGEDAINPQYYPNVLNSTKFIVGLFDIEVESKDGTLKTTLYDYLKNHQKEPWWSLLNPMKLTKLLKKGDKQEDSRVAQLPGIYLTKEQDEVVDAIKDMISCKFNQQDEFITITATAQDPLISTELVDSVSSRLQSFIIDYRTSKARHDLTHMQKLYDEAAERYTKARIQYAEYADSYGKLTMQSYITKREDLENKMQLEYNIYSTLAQQLQVAKGKVLERTPVFAVIEAATVPLRKDSPKMLLITLGWMIVAMMGTMAWVLYKKKQ